ncbi:hypothetical protein Tco_0623897 [Tanacetum coccineum]|uniref:Reverse transcriptase domain-containing protein n=1 Tax=Tanacetum coccineum TaxID=301880 RepID=A0ABQ4WCB0_9ASTR
MDLTKAGVNRFLHINELDEMRLDAYESSISYKERTKRWHDKRIKAPTNYERGDKVLLFNSRLRLFPGKLKSRWYGPFSVSKDMKNGAIELYDEDGNEFIVNKQRVKPYQKNVLDTNRDDDITLDDEGEVTVICIYLIISREISVLNQVYLLLYVLEDVEPKPNLTLQEIIILDPDDQPIYENAKIVAPTPNYAIIQLDVDDNFVINSTHLKMILENKFDGYLRADPHDHIREFLAICDMFKYGETQSEAVKLLIFPFSLCDKAKTWFNELNEESITSWSHIWGAGVGSNDNRVFIINAGPPSVILNVLFYTLKSGKFDHKKRVNSIGDICYVGLNEWKWFLVFIIDFGMDSQIISLNEELQDMREKYNKLRNGNASKNHLNDDTPMCERHEANYIQSEDYQNRNSYDSFSHQSLHDPNDSEKSLTELNNDVRNDLEDFKRRIRSMRTVHWKLYDNDDRKTTGVLPNKKSKPINQEPQSKTDFEKLMTKFLDGQRVTNMFFKNNVNDMILKMKQNEKNFQTIFKNMEIKIDEWEKSQNVSSEQTIGLTHLLLKLTPSMRMSYSPGVESPMIL